MDLWLFWESQDIGIERIVENLDSVVEFPFVNTKLNVSVLVRPAINKFNRNLYKPLNIPIKEGVYPQSRSKTGKGVLLARIFNS